VPRSQWPFPPQARRAYPGPRPAASKPFPALLAPNRAALARDAATLVLAKRSPKQDAGGRSDPALARRLSVIGYAQSRTADDASRACFRADLEPIPLTGLPGRR